MKYVAFLRGINISGKNKITIRTANTIKGIVKLLDK